MNSVDSVRQQYVDKCTEAQQAMKDAQSAAKEQRDSAISMANLVVRRKIERVISEVLQERDVEVAKAYFQYHHSVDAILAAYDEAIREAVTSRVEYMKGLLKGMAAPRPDRVVSAAKLR